MKMTQRVKKILANYQSDCPGVKTNLARLLMQGKLGGSGKLVILPVDQGFEHGPARSFAVNPAAYDPLYHYQMAVDAQLSAFAAPLGMLQAGADTFAGQIPTILKMNSANSLSEQAEGPNQAITGSIQDALELGCSAIGFTTYPGSNHNMELLEEIAELSREAKSYGIATVTWAYVRGTHLDKNAETAVDNIAYGAHMAALMGAHIIKVKLPTDHIDGTASKDAFQKNKIAISTPADRVKEVVRSCFDGRRMVVFSGGDAKGLDAVYDDARAIRDGGGHGSIIGRNAFQRPREEALEMFDKMIKILTAKQP